MERKRTYHWVDRATDLDMTEVERLTWRVGEDGRTVRERRLLRTEMDGVKIATPSDNKPEILKEGETSKDELTARFDRIARIKFSDVPLDSRLPQVLFEAPPLPSAKIWIAPDSMDMGVAFCYVSYAEATEWKFKGTASFDSKGMFSLRLEGQRLPLPGGDSVADLTVIDSQSFPIPTPIQ